jgi:hypothetical protein
LKGEEELMRHEMLRPFMILTLLTGASPSLATPEELDSAEQETHRPTSRPVLQFDLADEETSIRFGLVAQLQIDWSMRDRDVDGLEQDYRFVLRRLRPDLRGTLLTRNLAYRLYLNVVPGSLELMEYWVDYRFHDHARVRIGQIKVPFTRYRLNSFRDLPFVDWSNPTRWFGAERQIGVMLHNGVGRPPAVEYELGVFTGANARASNAVGMSRAYGERPSNPSNLSDPSFVDGVHPEVIAHLGYNYGEINSRTTSDLEGGPLRFLVGISGAWDFNPTPTEDMRFRLAPEVLLKARGFFAQGVFYLGGFDEIRGGSRARLGVLSTLLQAGYLFRGRFEFAARYSLIYVLPSLRHDARRYADDLIDGAETEEDAQELTAHYESVGQVIAEHDVGLGVSIYLVGAALILRVDGSMLIHERLDDDFVEGRVRLMLQMAF